MFYFILFEVVDWSRFLKVLNTSEFAETFNRVIVKINVLRIIDNVIQSKVNPNNLNIATQLPSQQEIRAKLPELSLKGFSGKPTEW